MVVTSILPTNSLSGAEIDAAVRSYLERGEPLFRVNATSLKELRPDLIIAQAVCDVCAAANHEVAVALQAVPDAKVLWLNLSTLDDVLNDILRIAKALGVQERGEKLVAQLRNRLEAVRAKTQKVNHRPRVWVAEWVDPPFCCGHWLPEMVEIAGGVEGLGKKGQPSRRIAWDEVLAWRPEIIVLAPCGYRLEQTLRDAETLRNLPDWANLPAVRSGQVYAADGDYFSCPGVRLVDGVELLAHLLHPEQFPAPTLPHGFVRCNI
ncbi:MAG: hypothetical protein KEFWMYNX_002413 [Candidatus Fervidibacter sp.]